MTKKEIIDQLDTDPNDIDILVELAQAIEEYIGWGWRYDYEIERSSEGWMARFYNVELVQRRSIADQIYDLKDGDAITIDEILTACGQDEEEDETY